MRIITKKRLEEAAKRHAKARSAIYHWHELAQWAVWRHLPDTRATFPHADQVTVKSGRTVTVFNLTNDFRLITAIHYNRSCIYILMVLTHPEYDAAEWKRTL